VEYALPLVPAKSLPSGTPRLAVVYVLAWYDLLQSRFFSGALSDRLGARAVVLLGGVPGFACYRSSLLLVRHARRDDPATTIEPQWVAKVRSATRP